jgi:lambda repressor-like predicted transcriptional regulator
MSTIIQDKSKSAADLMTANVRAYVAIQSAYEQCSPEIREAIDEMLAIMKSPDASPDEKERAVFTIVEALFPNLAVDFLATCEAIHHSPPAVAVRDAMRAEEESFAKNVQEIMKQRDLTQDALARLAGVGQSAISNMLNRHSRPQKRTVVKIAGALGVEPSRLWPGIENGELD